MMFVEWCNENQGFVTAIFSLLSLLLSTIAIGISISTAKRPYKRAMRISAGSWLGIGNDMEGNQGIYVKALNIGNVPINVVDVGMMLGNNICIKVDAISNLRCVLKQMEEVEQSFSREELKETFRGKKGRVYAFAKDAEGYIYKKYVCKTSDL